MYEQTEEKDLDTTLTTAQRDSTTTEPGGHPPASRCGGGGATGAALYNTRAQPALALAHAQSRRLRSG